MIITESLVSYRRYAIRLEKRRERLSAQLVEANQLRRGAGLPTYELSRKIDEQEPVLTRTEYASLAHERSGFKSFRTQQLGQAIAPDTAQATNWQDQRARLIRRAFVEHQIQKAWQTKALPDSLIPNPS